MHILCILFSILSALTYVSLLTPNILEQYAQETILDGRTYLCAINSCSCSAIEKSIQLMCEAIDYFKTEVANGTPLTYSDIARRVINGSLEIEPYCKDPTYVCCTKTKKQAPENIIEGAESALRLGYALDCLKFVSQNELVTVESFFEEVVQVVINSPPAQGMQCVDFATKEKLVLAEKLENLYQSVYGTRCERNDESEIDRQHCCSSLNCFLRG